MKNIVWNVFVSLKKNFQTSDKINVIAYYSQNNRVTTPTD